MVSPEENLEKKKRYYEKLSLDLNRSLRYHYSAARKGAGKRNIGFYITEQTIVDLWKKQKGKCALSGVDMTLTHGTPTNPNPTKLSVDRIDNCLGYFPGNVQLITWQANTAKSVWSNQQLIDMCKAIATLHSK
jgi:hypothetical protein